MPTTIQVNGRELDIADKAIAFWDIEHSSSTNNYPVMNQHGDFAWTCAGTAPGPWWTFEELDDEKKQSGSCELYDVITTREPDWICDGYEASVQLLLSHIATPGFAGGSMGCSVSKCSSSGECSSSASTCPSGPQNNDGRTDCYACGSSVKKVPGMFPGSWYYICTACKK